MSTLLDDNKLIEHLQIDPKDSDLELAILSALRNSETPLGAVTLSLQLQEAMEISQASIGRKLKELDMRSLTMRVGYQGRSLTATGEAYLKNLVNAVVMNRRSEAFLHALRISDGDKLIQVLEARRALEKECARLATLRMKPTDLITLQDIVEKQRRAVHEGESGSYENLTFHETIAHLSQNEVLTEALHLVRSRSQLTLLVGTIREQVGGVLVHDHQEILDAMRKGNADLAEQAMGNHIDRLIADVRRYFALSEEETNH